MSTDGKPDHDELSDGTSSENSPTLASPNPELSEAEREIAIALAAALPSFDEILAEEIKAGRDIQFAPANMNRQRAASVGTLGLRYYAAGKTETAMEHEPDYLRLSQAERERKEREAKSIQ